jgi:hypothetical protein
VSATAGPIVIGREWTLPDGRAILWRAAPRLRERA